MEQATRTHSSVTVDLATKAQIDRISSAISQSRTQVIAQAIAAYSRVARIRKALDSSDEPKLEVRG